MLSRQKQLPANIRRALLLARFNLIALEPSGDLIRTGGGSKRYEPQELLKRDTVNPIALCIAKSVLNDLCMD